MKHYPTKGSLRPRHTIKSLKIITSPNTIKAQKKNILIHPSTLENFSFERLKTA